MLVGHTRVSTDGDPESAQLQRDASLAAGVDERHLFEDRASGSRDDRARRERHLPSSAPAIAAVCKLDPAGLSRRIWPDHGSRPEGARISAGSTSTAGGAGLPRGLRRPTWLTSTAETEPPTTSSCRRTRDRRGPAALAALLPRPGCSKRWELLRALGSVALTAPPHSMAVCQALGLPTPDRC